MGDREAQDKSSMAASVNMEDNQNSGNETNNTQDSITPCFIMTHSTGRIKAFQIGCMINEEFRHRAIEGIQEVNSRTWF